MGGGGVGKHSNNYSRCMGKVKRSMPNKLRVILLSEYFMSYDEESQYQQRVFLFKVENIDWLLGEELHVLIFHINFLARLLPANAISKLFYPVSLVFNSYTLQNSKVSYIDCNCCHVCPPPPPPNKMASEIVKRSILYSRPEAYHLCF